MSDSEYLPFSEIPAFIGSITGKTPSSVTVRRWVNKGYRGVKLKVTGPFHFRCVKKSDVIKFLDGCNSAEGHAVKIAERVENIPETDVVIRRLRDEFGFTKIGG